MIKQTHRAFGFAASSALLLGTYPFLPGFAEENVPLLAGQILIAQGGAVLASTWPDRLEILHRGFSHSIWNVLLLLAGTWYLMSYPLLFALCFGVTLGWFFHLFGDAFSVAGIAWFYPLQGYKRYGNGAFYVKCGRGPFLPLYKVGDSSFSFMPKVWWAVGILCFIGIWYRIGDTL